MEADDLMLTLVPTVTSAQTPVADCQGAERAELTKQIKTAVLFVGVLFFFFFVFLFPLLMRLEMPPNRR